MLKLLERNIEAIQDRLVLLAPSGVSVPDGFHNVIVDSDRRDEFVREMQLLRGSIYLEDGALCREELSADGLHQTMEDERSWHLLMLGRAGRVNACVWYLEHPTSSSIENLRVRNCPLAKSTSWSQTLRDAVSLEITRARENNLRYAEVGGWAVSQRCRCTSEGLVLALAAYSLGRRLGGSLGITTATVRHSSSTILKRLGGSHLEVGGTVVPSYFDPKYNCEMELLRFDSRQPNAKYGWLIEALRSRLNEVAVFASDTIGRHAAAPVASHFGYPSFAA